MRIILFILFISFSIFSYSQNDRNVRFSISSEIADMGYNQVNYTGLHWQVFVHRNISLNYNYSVGWTDEGRFLFHYPLLVSSIVWLEDIGEAGLLAILAPEGVSYHNYPNEILEVEVYCNPLCSDYNILGNEQITVTGSVGIKPHLKFNESISVAPNFGLKLIYGTGEVKQMMGLSVGVLF